MLYYYSVSQLWRNFAQNKEYRFRTFAHAVNMFAHAIQRVCTRYSARLRATYAMPQPHEARVKK